MRKITSFIFLAAATASIGAYGQSGINTVTPAATLEVKAKNATGTATSVDGLLIPRVDRERAQSMTNVPTSTLIYVNSIANGTAVGNIDAVGYYYYNGTAWVKLGIDGGSNIYNANGTLSGNRTVTLGASTLAFTGTTNNAFSVDGTTFSVNAINHRVGIGTRYPVTALHVAGGFVATGYVGIGTTAPSEALHVNGNIILSGKVGVGTAYPTEALHVLGNIILTGSVGVGTSYPAEAVHVNGNVLAYNVASPSDIRLKKDITDNTYGLKEILSLRTINYRYKDEKMGKDKKIGFIAQDVQAAMPELVLTGHDEKKTLAVNYAEITVVLTKAVQELQRMLKKEHLKNDVAVLKARLAKLEKRISYKKLPATGKI